MPKVTLPALSLAASGTLGRVLTFSNSGRRCLVRAVPPRRRAWSRAQVGVHAMNRFLTTEWSRVSDTQRATWSTLAARRRSSNYHAYLSYNMIRWRSFQPPSQAYPAAEISSYCEINSFVPTPLRQGIQLDIDGTWPNANWGIVILHQLDGAPGYHPDYCVASLYLDGPTGADTRWVHSPLTTGWHGYSAYRFSDDGNRSPMADYPPVWLD